MLKSCISLAEIILFFPYLAVSKVVNLFLSQEDVTDGTVLLIGFITNWSVKLVTREIALYDKQNDKTIQIDKRHS